MRRTVRLRRLYQSTGTDQTAVPLISTRTRRGRPMEEWRPYATGARWLVPATAWDVDAAWAACPDRAGPSPSQFDDLDQVRAFLRPFSRRDRSGATTS